MRNRTMTEQEHFVIQRTLAQLTPIKALAGALFHERLFVLIPDIRHHLDGNLGEHQRLFMQALASLATASGYREPLEALGRWHERHGLQPHHYLAMQEALLWMLRQTLGTVFDGDAHCAWESAFALLTETMTEAGAAERLALTRR
jgi:hemoglobin-like flavoprotein